MTLTGNSQAPSAGQAALPEIGLSVDYETLLYHDWSPTLLAIEALLLAEILYCRRKRLKSAKQALEGAPIGSRVSSKLETA